MNSAYCRFCLLIAIVSASWPAIPGWSQIVPDSSVNTVVTPTGTTLQIDGGTTAGTNLFHSFQDFSVPTGTAAFFNNPLRIENIITRVTGGKISNIDGLIRANGTANLFLLNPNGILFGPNAQLNIGGSFLGTTASSIKFADGSEFSATDTASSPLLTVSVPIGLNLGQNPGAITVQGQGNQLVDSTGFGSANASNSPLGLQAGANQTLALIGSSVNFSGGVVSTNGGGHLEVGSVSTGTVGLNATATGWVGDYSGVSQFNDIHLARQSLLDASGSNGSIQIQGQNISLSEGSVAIIQNLGTQTSGGMTVRATGHLNLTGNTSDGQSGSQLRLDNLGVGQTGDMNLFAAQLSVQNGAQIVAQTFTPAPGSNMRVDVTGDIDIDGFASGNPRTFSLIVVRTWNSGNGGNMTVSANNLRLLNGGVIGAITIRGSGQAGTVRVTAADSIEIAGNNPITLAPSLLNSATLSSGNGNNVFINTSRLVVREGGLLGSNTFSKGSVGNVTINASQSVEVTGRGAGSIIPSRIASTAEILDATTQAAFGLPAIPSGNAGSLTINTPSLRVTDRAIVSVKNDGPGQAGDIQINAGALVLDTQGSIIASTASGNGGDIRLNLQESLQLRNGSLISATAAGSGNGGNLSVSAPVIVGLENSDIIANAVQGRGGNIEIATQGIFGPEFRPQLTSGSDITASSQFGVSGNVRISTPDVQPNAALVELPANLIDPNQKVVQGCDAAQNNRFIATGRGGLPPNPTQRLEVEEHPWSDVRDLSAFRRQTRTTASAPKTSQPGLVEANGWKFNEQGQVEIYVSEAIIPNFLQPTCEDTNLSSL